jgi:peptide/nickel transport system substrate-binding protein
MRNRPKRRLFGMLMALCLAAVACQPAAPAQPPAASGPAATAAPAAAKPTESKPAEAKPGESKPAAAVPTAAIPPATGVAASASKPAAQKSSKDSLTIAYCCVQSTLDPHFAATTADALFMRNIHNALVKYRPNSVEIVPDLATSWEMSPDGLQYTFKLRQDVEWHKGYGKFTANDVKASFERLLSPETKSPFAGSMSMLQEVQVVDDSTVKMVLKVPYAGFLHLLTPYRAGPIVNAKAVKDFGAEFAWNPIGTGPYVFESRVPNREGVIAANEKYFDGPPPIKKITFKTIPDANAQILGLENGEFDLLYSPVEDPVVVERLKGKGLAEAVFSRNLPNVIHMNVTAKPWDDVRVRRAVAHSIDRKQLIELARGGYGEPLYSPIPKGYFGHSEDVPRYDYDIAKAKALLAEAGYPNGLDVTMTNFDTFKLSSEVIIEQIKAAGIRVTSEMLDQPTFIGRVIKNEGIDFTIHCCVRQPDPDIWLTDALTPKGGAIYISRYDLEKELEPARRELDPKKREQLYLEIQRKIMTDLPIIPLIMQPERMMHTAKLKGMPTLEPLWGLDLPRLYFE